mmetsp:Transcript_43825/g.117048  ORF Transcript_43825/g.117048 Transcript_43825/m.117048 type:complete len:254 (+) Transcript_43825:158-919(+)
MAGCSCSSRARRWLQREAICLSGSPSLLTRRKSRPASCSALAQSRSKTTLHAFFLTCGSESCSAASRCSTNCAYLCFMASSKNQKAMSRSSSLDPVPLSVSTGCSWKKESLRSGSRSARKRSLSVSMAMMASRLPLRPAILSSMSSTGMRCMGDSCTMSSMDAILSASVPEEITFLRKSLLLLDEPLPLCDSARSMSDSSLSLALTFILSALNWVCDFLLFFLDSSLCFIVGMNSYHFPTLPIGKSKEGRLSS